MQTCSEPGCGRPAVKATGRCTEHRRKARAAEDEDGLTLSLPADVTAWLQLQGDAPAATIVRLVRQEIGASSRTTAVQAAVHDFFQSQEATLAAAIVARLEGKAAPPAAAPRPGPAAGPAPVPGAWSGMPSGSPWGSPTPPPPPPPAQDNCQEFIDKMEARDPALARRAAALVRYPQLVEAVAKDLVSIDRAEEMAGEADARSRR